MAQAFVNFSDIAKLAKECATKAKELRILMKRLDDNHTKNDYSLAGDASKPAWVQEDSEGNIKGLDYTRANYINMVTFARQVEKLFTNQAVTQGDYLSTVEQVADA